MYQNYFFLNRLILEANTIIKDGVVSEIFSQEKGTLILGCEKTSEEFFIEISVIPGNSYFTIKNKFNRAKKNTITFFEDASDQTVNSVAISNDDRIIKISLEKSELYFIIRGKFTNVFYLDENNVFLPFKSVSGDQFEIIKKDLLNKSYKSEWNDLKLTKDKDRNNLDELRKKYPIIGSDIIKEAKARLSNESSGEIGIINEILEEIKTSSVCVFIDDDSQEVNIGFENFRSLPFTEKKLFEDTIEALNFFLSKEYYYSAKKSRLKLIRYYLERELNKVSSKINNLKGVIERGSKEKEYNKFGNLLLTNISALKPGMKSINVIDFLNDGNEIEIKLDPKLTPQKNIDYYFDKSKAERIAFAKTNELFIKANKDFESLNKSINSLEEIDSVKQLDEMMNEYKIKPIAGKDQKENISEKFKHYLVEGKYNVFVGKDSKNNDLLTTKFAKQNDYWFHARSVSGSHVVLRVDNVKEPVPKNILKKAAALAAFHSKAKTAGIVPVAFTLKKYVVKKKGDPAGTVHLLREDVLLVKPEIPVGCEYIIDE